MKKSLLLLLLLLLPLVTMTAFGQESRQDISVSGSALLPPTLVGRGAHFQADPGVGVLISYRYLLTPRSGLELNYQYAQQNLTIFNQTNKVGIHARFQEMSGAYVRSFVFGNWNPFVEGGIGGFIYSPIDDEGTNFQGLTKSTNVGALYGGGFAYEISPSFDIRAEYRGIIVKAPNFGVNDFSTGRYFNISDPVIGIAYHF
jgi:outer membrane immunogenic protein